MLSVSLSFRDLLLKASFDAAKLNGADEVVGVLDASLKGSLDWNDVDGCDGLLMKSWG